MGERGYGLDNVWSTQTRSVTIGLNHVDCSGDVHVQCACKWTNTVYPERKWYISREWTPSSIRTGADTSIMWPASNLRVTWRCCCAVCHRPMKVFRWSSKALSFISCCEYRETYCYFAAYVHVYSHFVLRNLSLNDFTEGIATILHIPVPYYPCKVQYCILAVIRAPSIISASPCFGLTWVSNLV